VIEFRRRHRIDSNIDMTPMIDTLLQLFVVFLLSMSFLTSAVRLDLPRASAQQAAPESPVVVAIDSTGQWHVNSEPVARNQLAGRLAPLLAKDGKREVMLRADGSLKYDKVVEAIVEIQRAGAGSVILAYDPKEGGS
jgi:biopolymer transport protein ExbD